jgi:hypothetical protein
LERHWRYTWQEKLPRRGKTPTPPHLHLHIASLGQVKWRNQEGSHAARHQLLTYMGDATIELPLKHHHQDWILRD